MASLPDVNTIALVTGAGSGFGKAVVELMVSRGSKVIVADINLEHAKEVANALNTKAGETVAVAKKVDTADWEDQKTLFVETIAMYGRIDYVFANAGIAEIPFLPRESSPEFVKPNLRTLEVDLHGQLFTSALALQQFQKQSYGPRGYKGKLILTCSVYGFYPCPGMPMYATAKHGIVAFMRSEAAHYADSGITINAVCPNLVRTAIVSDDFLKPFEEQGLLTDLSLVVQAFESLVGDSDLNGCALGVNQGGVWVHPQDEFRWEENKAPLELISEMMGEGKR